jgi:hypothetical protein
MSLLLSVFDRPKFEAHDSLLKGNASAELYCIVATTTEKNFGAHVKRLLIGSLKGIQALSNGKVILQDAARIYGSVEGAEKLGLCLYFDDPKEKGSPRWAVGWAVHAKSFADIQNLVNAVQEKSGLTETFRAVHLVNGSVLKATIPWRGSLTPLVGAMLHWPRAFKAYKEGGYSSTCGRPDEEGSIALEVYLSGPGDSMKYMEYVVLFGNTTTVWDDCFPAEGTTATNDGETS